MPETTHPRTGFHFLLLLALPACGSPPPRAVHDTAAGQNAPAPDTRAVHETPQEVGAVHDTPQPPPPPPPEVSLGVVDTGIWSDLDGQVQLALPEGLEAGRISAAIHGATLVLEIDGWPVKPYPLDGEVEIAAGDRTLRLRAGDAAELAGLLTADNVREEAADDRDGDALPDPLDVLIGAKKTAIQAGTYGAGYLTLEYPGGDVPRDKGVCTDVVIRAMRNAGVDLQKEVHRDIGKHPKAYPMVKKRGGDKNIDHRRVKTILPWFKRHMEAHTARLDDPDDPLRPGDIVFMDTFPERAGPDHIGVVSDQLGDDGLPLVINSWTTGYVTQEMDLLGFVPVTHRFRL